MSAIYKFFCYTGSTIFKLDIVKVGNQPTNQYLLNVLPAIINVSVRNMSNPRPIDCFDWKMIKENLAHQRPPFSHRSLTEPHSSLQPSLHSQAGSCSVNDLVVFLAASTPAFPKHLSSLTSISLPPGAVSQYVILSAALSSLCWGVWQHGHAYILKEMFIYSSWFNLLYMLFEI